MRTCMWKTDRITARLSSAIYRCGAAMRYGPFSSTHFETARTSGAKLSILPSAALSLCCRISRNDRFSTRTASSFRIVSYQSSR